MHVSTRHARSIKGSNLIACFFFFSSGLVSMKHKLTMGGLKGYCSGKSMRKQNFPPA